VGGYRREEVGRIYTYDFSLDPEFGELLFVFFAGFGGVVCYKDDLLA